MFLTFGQQKVCNIIASMLPYATHKIGKSVQKFTMKIHPFLLRIRWCEFHEMLIQESTEGEIQGNYSCSSTTQRCGSRTFMGGLAVNENCQLCSSTEPSASTKSTSLGPGGWKAGSAAQSFLIRRSPKNVQGSISLQC